MIHWLKTKVPSSLLIVEATATQTIKLGQLKGRIEKGLNGYSRFIHSHQPGKEEYGNKLGG